jgi:hypothetical protein
MTPKEKAEQLVVKFLKHSRAEKDITPIQSAKQCALIAVNEVQQLIKDLSSDENRFIYIIDEMNYWEKVKQEIENL